MSEKLYKKVSSLIDDDQELDAKGKEIIKAGFGLFCSINTSLGRIADALERKSSDPPPRPEPSKPFTKA